MSSVRVTCSHPYPAFESLEKCSTTAKSSFVDYVGKIMYAIVSIGTLLEPILFPYFFDPIANITTQVTTVSTN